MKTIGNQIKQGKRGIDTLACLCCLLGAVAYSQAQTTNIVAGTAKDGVLVVASNTTNIINQSTGVTGNNPAGGNVLSVSSTNGFSDGDLVLIIAMQDPNMNFAQNITGTYEFERISGMANSAFTFNQSLSNSYDIYQSGVQIQAVHVPEYSAVIVNGILTAGAWNGTTGGVLAFLCQNYLFIGSNGVITMDGEGYRGGLGDDPNGDYCLTVGYQGEATTGPGISAETANLQGGGGSGWQNNSQGGGGGYGSAGNAGRAGGQSTCNVRSGAIGGSGGIAFGFPDLRTLCLGGAGGGDGGYNDGPGLYGHGGTGGNGGGVVFIAANNIIGTGTIACCGVNGTYGPSDNGFGVPWDSTLQPGGGGAGGSLYLLGQISGTTSVQCTGGGGPGGSGGYGRIRFDLTPESLSNSIPPAGFTTNLTASPFFGSLLNYSTNGVGLPPYFLSQPQSQVAIPGSNVTWQVAVSYGAQPLYYQWQFNGINLSGQTNSTLTLSNVQSVNDGVYDVVVWNYLGTNTTIPVSLFVQYTNAYYYDHNNRLVGVEYAYGVSIAYVYAANGNLLQQVYLSRSYESNGLPVLWRFLNGLSPTDNTGTNSLYSDADGNGWSNFAKWLLGLNPLNLNSVPTNPPPSNPVAIVLPATNTLGPQASVPIVMSNFLGNPSIPYLQYQFTNSSNWQTATILSVDGASYSTNFSSGVTAWPTGSSHVLIWNALGDLGEVVTNVWLRAQAVDVETNGAWSTNVMYAVNTLPPFQINPSSFQLTTNGFQFQVVGLNGSGPVIIYASTNLIQWTPIYTNAPVVGTLTFTDPAAPSLQARYYMVIEQ